MPLPASPITSSAGAIARPARKSITRSSSSSRPTSASGQVLLGRTSDSAPLAAAISAVVDSALRGCPHSGQNRNSAAAWAPHAAQT